jgi:hypothetical protein
MKICTSCKNQKDLSDFRFRKDRCAYISTCKQCEKEQNKIYKFLNKEKNSQSRKIYYINNKEKENLSNKKWIEDNKEKRNTYKTLYNKNRLKTDPLFKIRQSVSRVIYNYLSSNKNNKSCLNYLPYTIQELKQHLESQFEFWMNWNNWGIYNSKIWNDNDFSTWTWQIDHIIPQSDLPYESMEDDNFKKCWSLKNLRPYSAKQNCLDGVNKVRHLNG